MSKRIGNAVIICAEAEQQCDLCGKIDELRPYGANGECICYECGMKDKDTTEKMMNKVLFGLGEENQLVDRWKIFHLSGY